MKKLVMGTYRSSNYKQEARYITVHGEAGVIQIADLAWGRIYTFAGQWARLMCFRRSPPEKKCF